MDDSSDSDASLCSLVWESTSKVAQISESSLDEETIEEMKVEKEKRVKKRSISEGDAKSKDKKKNQKEGKKRKSKEQESLNNNKSQSESFSEEGSFNESVDHGSKGKKKKTKEGRKSKDKTNSSNKTLSESMTEDGDFKESFTEESKENGVNQKEEEMNRQNEDLNHNKIQSSSSMDDESDSDETIVRQIIEEAERESKQSENNHSYKIDREFNTGNTSLNANAALDYLNRKVKEEQMSFENDALDYLNRKVKEEQLSYMQEKSLANTASRVSFQNLPTNNQESDDSSNHKRKSIELEHINKKSESKAKKKKTLSRKDSSDEESRGPSHISTIRECSNASINNLSYGGADEISAILPCNDTQLDHDFSDTEKTEAQAKVPTKSILKKNCTIETYEPVNAYLKQTSRKLPAGAIINDDDDVWLLSLPHDITIDMLKSKKITIDNKCKLKTNNDTYNGILETTVTSCNLLTNKNDLNIITHKIINGSIKLHKRLPKVRAAVEDGNATQSVIPLPVTKCRHPLFGSDYEQSIIIPPSIRETLEENPVKRKKDKKKRKREKEQSEAEKDVCFKNVKSETDVKEEPMDYDSEVKVKKKRKLHRSINEDGEHVAKRKKYNEVNKWENEEAIEDTLFNS